MYMKSPKPISTITAPSLPQVNLPFAVDGDSGSATFDTEKSLLTLTLPVVKVEEDKAALQHLEAEGEEQEGGNHVKGGEKEKEAGDGEEPAMIRAQKLGGMAMPRRLGNNMMF